MATRSGVLKHGEKLEFGPRYVFWTLPGAVDTCFTSTVLCLDWSVPL
jgi:hypothetical protein